MKSWISTVSSISPLYRVDEWLVSVRPLDATSELHGSLGTGQAFFDVVDEAKATLGSAIRRYSRATCAQRPRVPFPCKALVDVCTRVLALPSGPTHAPAKAGAIETLRGLYVVRHPPDRRARARYERSPVSVIRAACSDKSLASLLGREWDASTWKRTATPPLSADSSSSRGDWEQVLRSEWNALFAKMLVAMTRYKSSRERGRVR